MKETLYWFLVFFCAAQRIWELILSKNNQEKLKQEGFELREKNLDYFFMVSLHCIWFIGLVVEPLYLESNFLSLISTISLVVFILAQVLRFWTLKTLGKHWNTQIMAPNAAKPDSFVTSGPYGFIKHPNYLVVILELVSLPLIAGAYITAASISILNALILYRRIILEEKFLNTRPGYIEKMGNKYRFLPGIF